MDKRRIEKIKIMLLKYRRILIILFHLFLIVLSYLLSFLLRFDFVIPGKHFAGFLKTLPLLVLVKLVVFYYFRIYSGLWRYVSMDDLWQIIKANSIATVSFILAEVFVYGTTGFPRSVFLIDFVICTVLVGGVRFMTRLVKERARNDFLKEQKKVLLVGAGETGIVILKEYRKNPSLGEVVGFIDDDPVKHSESLHGVKILGGRKDIQKVVKRYGVEEIVLAITSAKGEVIRDIISYCQIPGVKLKTLPGLHKIIKGELEVKPREVKADDLLGREPVLIDEAEISRYLKDKRVMVTGAGGSIGSELCWQIARFSPKEIILFDHNENDVYFLTVDFKTKYPDLRIKTVIGDIKDIGLLKQTFSRYKPQIIFHAAAHKHVPLMEENPTAAVKNNIIGSRNLIYAANHYHVERFVLISTDKAVNPINVMGMSKRIAEMILQAKAKNSKTKFMAVRFGNVIGSDGSVVPLFKKQIEEGGPLTITDPEAKRYFMSTEEAALLVLQAGAIGKGGELFILDMGEQIKIVDLARNLVALSGLTIDKDITVQFTGLRPGEKVSEELLLDKEKDKVTKHEKIYVSQSQEFNPVKLRSQVKKLEKLAQLMDEKAIVEEMKGIIGS